MYMGSVRENKEETARSINRDADTPLFLIWS